MVANFQVRIKKKAVNAVFLRVSGKYYDNYNSPVRVKNKGFTMDIATALQQRRAHKIFDKDYVISQVEIEALLKDVMLSPTSFNIQHWRFVVVTDAEQRKAMRAIAWDQAHVTDSSFVVLICADTKAWDKQPERYWRNLSADIQTVVVNKIRGFYKGHDQLQRDEAFRSVGIAAQSLMLRAQEMGYETCPMIGFDAQAMADIIHLPDDHVIGMMVAVGKSAGEARPRGGAMAYDDVVFYNKF
jgi:nitroreductase